MVKFGPYSLPGLYELLPGGSCAGVRGPAVLVEADEGDGRFRDKSRVEEPARYGMISANLVSVDESLVDEV